MGRVTTPRYRACHYALGIASEHTRRSHALASSQTSEASNGRDALRHIPLRYFQQEILPPHRDG